MPGLRGMPFINSCPSENLLEYEPFIETWKDDLARDLSIPILIRVHGVQVLMLHLKGYIGGREHAKNILRAVQG